MTWSEKLSSTESEYTGWKKRKVITMSREWKTVLLTILDYQTMASKDVLTSLKRVGCEGIQWTTKGYFDPDKGINRLREIVIRTEDPGLGVSQIMDHKDLISSDDHKQRDEIQRTVRVIEAAGECGLPAVSVLTGPAIWEKTHVVIGENMSKVIREIRQSRLWKLSVRPLMHRVRK